MVAERADRQYGVVTRQQLLASGLRTDTIGRAVRAGRLRPMFGGVYSLVGYGALSQEGWWMGALLACGEGSALSHDAAGVFWRFFNAPRLPIHVTTAGQRMRAEPRIRTHRLDLPTADTVVRDRLRITTPGRTIVDMAAGRDGRELRGIVERAQDVRRFHPNQIQTILDRPAQLRGVGGLRDLLVLIGSDADGAKSKLERLFLALVRRHRLALPEVNVRVEGRERDFVWREQRLVVETDGYRYHSSRQAQRRDRKRDRELTAAGWRPARFTYEEVAFEPDEVALELARLLHTR